MQQGGALNGPTGPYQAITSLAYLPLGHKRTLAPAAIRRRAV